MGKNLNTYKTFNIHEKTPSAIYEELNKEFLFDFDPCPLSLDPEFDGLKIDWGKSCFINPPYGKQVRFWLEKALSEIEKGHTKTVVFLLPSYTDVKWFHEVVIPYAKEIRFFKGRIKFGEHKRTAPFASVIIIFEKAKEEEKPHA